MDPSAAIVIISIFGLILWAANSLGQLRIVSAFMSATLIVPIVFTIIVETYNTTTKIDHSFDFKSIYLLTGLFFLLGTPVVLAIGLPIFLQLKSLSFSYYISFPLVYTAISIIGLKLFSGREFELEAVLTFTICGLVHSGTILLFEKLYSFMDT